ncbi:YheT family hydrolase [Algoriphagus taiwanensis]|uniref:Alpha/beta fold hydrolase n=1 Tax=Algoriphagus taiwanensis TaxID=1445656 RepID=A0ABQ6PX08_9BACT|nr:alpha/beta fold hydrolase [Algoriphagus taiwanensis]
MPVISNSQFIRPKWLFNGHLETIYPAFFRKVSPQKPHHEKIKTSDGDFLELDWYSQGSQRLVIVSHGLEGNSTRPYVLGMVREFIRRGFDVLAWNYRGCGTEMNQKPIFYHSGATYDLDTVVDHAGKKYQEINLIGFSLGGNLTLKYLGEKRIRNPKIRKAVAISVPVDLAKSCDKISSGENIIYSKRFLSTLKEKVIRKSQLFPGELPIQDLSKVKTLRDFDDFFTGPLHGFQDAAEYYEVNSSVQFLDQIEVPTLLLNAQNDPFLSETCFPVRICRKSETVHLEIPKHGGHVGFTPRHSEKSHYSEQRAVEFITADL